MTSRWLRTWIAVLAPLSWMFAEACSAEGPLRGGELGPLLHSVDEMVAPAIFFDNASIGDVSLLETAEFFHVRPSQSMRLPTVRPFSYIPNLLDEIPAEQMGDQTADRDPIVLLVQQPGGGGDISLGGGSPGRSRGGIASNSVTGSQASLLPSSDAGALLGSSSSVVGVGMQKRNLIVTDVRTRGAHVGQMLASGSYWVPARADLDTLLNKIDSRAIDQMIVIKGPYSARLGPGFNFVDFSLIPAPRYEDGFQSGGQSSFDYKTNGQQWYGRQTVEAGSDNWGARVSYGHRTGNDYQTGNGSGAGFAIPASYNSRNLEAAIGFDPTEADHLEFNYLRLDQTNVEFPGMVFDMRYLVTESFELAYVAEDRPGFDRLEFETWYNRTRFEGDTLAAGKMRQIPTLACNLFPYDGSGDVESIDACLAMPGMGMGTAVTDADVMTTGYSSIFTFGDDGGSQLHLGSDLRYIERSLNDIEPLAPPEDSNFPIPPSFWANPGLLLEYSEPLSDRLTVHAGGRFDVVVADAQNIVPGVGETIEGPPGTFTSTPITISDRLRTDTLDRQFTLWSFFTTAERQLNDSTTLTGGFGFAQRAPTLTELYSAGAFINLLQSGLTTLSGDPDLRKERLTQIDLGLRYDRGNVRASANGYYSWIHDYITFDASEITEDQIGQKTNRVTLVNTELATLTGVELFGELDVSPMLTAFATMSYIQGQDQTRLAPSRPRGVGFRSGVGDPREPLPNIAPLESLLGLRFHSAEDGQPWSIEFQARVVDNQSRVAYSLYERDTPGYTIYSIRSHWRVRENFLVTGGVENLGDKFYRSHLDYRAGLGVYQPGTNFYLGSELTY